MAGWRILGMWLLLVVALPAAAAACRVVPAGLTESVGDLAALTVAAYRLRLAAAEKKEGTE